MAEFQIIPKYISGKDIIINLITNLRKKQINKIYIITQDLPKDSKTLRQLKDLCDKYFISYHTEDVNFKFLNEEKFEYYKGCLKTGLPEAFVVFGSEIAINTAKLLNYLISNKLIINLSDFINNLNNKNDYPLPIYCVLNDFTLGSENNFFGIIKIQYLDKIDRYVFNANSMPEVIYTNEELYNHLEYKYLENNLIGMIVRCIEQYLSINGMEWTRNYILANLQSLIDIKQNYDFEKDKSIILKNLIWINLCINNGIANFLNNSDWLLHIFSYEVIKYFNDDLNASLAYFVIEYLKLRSKWDIKINQILNDLKSKLLHPAVDINEFFIFIEKIISSFNYAKKTIDNISEDEIRNIIDSVIKKITINNKNDNMKSFLNKLIRYSPKNK